MTPAVVGEALGRNGLSVRSTVSGTAPQRQRCPICRQAAVNCYCSALVPQRTNGARFVFLQHPAEARNPVGTARMAHLSLPGSSLFVGVDFSQERRLRELLDSAAHPCVLFPADGALPLETLREASIPPTVVVIDGTWSQARKIWKLNPFLRALPACRIAPKVPSRYRIRAEPEAHCLSTIEAVAAALEALDGTSHDSMLRPFLALVDRQVARASAPDRSPRHHPRPPRPPSLPPLLSAHPENALLVHVGSNGFPKGRPGQTPNGEVVRLLARRLRSGENFSALTLPQRRGPRFDPSELIGEDLRRAVPLETLRSQWRDFLKPEDIWLTWTDFPRALMAQSGLETREAGDLKHWCAGRLSQNPGAIGRAAELLGITQGGPESPKKAERELDLLEAIFRRLLAKTSAQRHAETAWTLRTSGA